MQFRPLAVKGVFDFVRRAFLALRYMLRHLRGLEAKQELGGQLHHIRVRQLQPRKSLNGAGLPGLLNSSQLQILRSFAVAHVLSLMIFTPSCNRRGAISKRCGHVLRSKSEVKLETILGQSCRALSPLDLHFYRVAFRLVICIGCVKLKILLKESQGSCVKRLDL